MQYIHKELMNRGRGTSTPLSFLKKSLIAILFQVAVKHIDRLSFIYIYYCIQTYTKI